MKSMTVRIVKQQIIRMIGDVRGRYIRIKAKMVYADKNFCNDIYFNRKPIDEVEIGDSITMHNSYVYKVLNKVEKYSEKNGYFYKLSLQGLGPAKFSDGEYCNCVLY